LKKIGSFKLRKTSDSDRSKKTKPLKLRKEDKTKKTIPPKLRKEDKTKKTIPLKLRRKDKTKKEGIIKLQKPGTEDSTKLGIFKWTGFVKNIGKKKSFLGILGIIVLIAAVAIWAGDYKKPSLNQNKNADTNFTGLKNHYDNGVISFDYPKGWNITPNPQPPLIVTVEQNENNSFSVLSENLEYSNFAQKVLEWKTNLQKNGMIYYEGITTVDGSDAYEIQGNYKPGNKIYSTRGIALVRDQTAYFIIFIFDKPLLDYKKEMDIVINSFHVNQTS
jgi:PsbP-like protein